MANFITLNLNLKVDLQKFFPFLFLIKFFLIKWCMHRKAHLADLVKKAPYMKNLPNCRQLTPIQHHATVILSQPNQRNELPQ